MQRKTGKVVAFSLVGLRRYITLHGTDALPILVLQVRTFHTWLTALTNGAALYTYAASCRRETLGAGHYDRGAENTAICSSLSLESTCTRDLEVEGELVENASTAPQVSRVLLRK